MRRLLCLLTSSTVLPRGVHPFFLARSCRYVSMRRNVHDTIYALSSGRGVAGVAVIRISGPRADDVLLAMSRTKKITIGKTSNFTNSGRSKNKRNVRSSYGTSI
mmetsp:Transcript_342/g.486  ORF Transcript_342/g.486 Transcript_342/m.486 type:complete len:104 (-) Transcript_342:1237-1548(-)